MAERKVSVRLALVGGKEVEDELRRIGAEGSGNLNRLGTDGARSFDQLGKSSGATKVAIQNTAFQLQDFAVQVAGGTSATRAMSQQLPQLLSGFGLWGVLAGTAAAVMIPLVGSLFDGADAASQFTDELLKSGGTASSVASAISAVQDVARTYNDTINQTGGASSAAAQAVIANSEAEFQARKEVLNVEIELLRIRGQERKEAAQNLTDQIEKSRNSTMEDLGTAAAMRADARTIRTFGTNAALGAQTPPDALATLLPGFSSVQNAGAVDSLIESRKTDLLALQKLNAEGRLDDLQLAAAEEIYSKDFKDLQTAVAATVPASRAAGGASRAAAEEAAAGWQAAVDGLKQYAEAAKDIGKDVGDAIVGAFRGAETAVGNFVNTGKFSFHDMVTSMLADLAQLAIRKTVLGPLATALQGSLSGGGLGWLGSWINAGTSASVNHDGGLVGAGGLRRSVPAAVFAGAARFHDGGWPGLRSDEVPAILQRGERVQSRDEVRQGLGARPLAVTINARDAESFRQSRVQVATDLARAIAFGQRGY